ncbi:nuclear transport factor 2 family protein [Actinocorallia aurantiaca]|uniref:SnoaL-like domain-containing protein n=1 Tax=Actinocorallia aurantiaca TaxID=46204 RepID=A0ABN3UH63_9ACTN
MDGIEALEQPKVRYRRALDTEDRGAMRRVFADDVVVDTTGSGGSVVTGADVFLVFLDSAPDRENPIASSRRCGRPAGSTRWTSGRSRGPPPPPTSS